MPDIETATPVREVTPTHSSNRVEPRTSEESKPPEQAPEMRAPPDPNLVDWESMHDPNNPLNWPTWRKTVNITIILMMCVTQ